MKSKAQKSATANALTAAMRSTLRIHGRGWWGIESIDLFRRVDVDVNDSCIRAAADNQATERFDLIALPCPRSTAMKSVERSR